MAGTISTGFTNSDLDGNFEYTWTHGQDTIDVIPSWVDDTGDVREGPNTFTIIDSNNIKINTGGPITGDNVIILMYDNGATIQGRELFGFSASTSIDDTHKIALGRGSSSPSPDTINVTYSDFKQNVLADLGTGYAQVANDLSEFSSASKASNARANLSVYSQSTIDGLLSNYVLETEAFSKTNADAKSTGYVVQTDPGSLVQKKYVDDTINAAVPTPVSVPLSTSVKASQITFNSLQGHRYGNVYVISVRFTFTGSLNTGTYYPLFIINGCKPSTDRYGSLAMESPTNYESGSFLLDYNGSASGAILKVRLGKTGVWVGGMTIIDD